MIHEGKAHLVNSVEMSSNSGDHILEIPKEQKEILEERNGGGGCGGKQCF